MPSGMPLTESRTEQMSSTFNALVGKIHKGINPYEGFPVQDWPVYWGPGWDSEHRYFHEAIDLLKPSIIVEVGTFMGSSARHMARWLAASKLDACIICVDTWLAEDVLWTNEMWRPHLKHRFGRPEFYNTFMANTITAGLQSYIVPLPMPSSAAARYLNALGIRSPLVYVDGDHAEGAAYADFKNFWELVMGPAGVMLIDDYQPENTMFAGLVRDVDKFTIEQRIEPKFSGNKVWLTK